MDKVNNFLHNFSLVRWTDEFDISFILNQYVVDPWHFGTDPDPRIRTPVLWVRIRIRIVPFSSVGDKMPTNKFFCLFVFEGYIFTSVFTFRDKKSKRSHKKVEIKVFLTFFACWWKDPGPYKIMTDPDPGGPKTNSSGSTTLFCFKLWWGKIESDTKRYLLNTVHIFSIRLLQFSNACFIFFSRYV